MKRWLPSIEVQGSCIGASDYEAEGHVIVIRWGKFIVELGFLKVDRIYAEEPSDAR
ncbi:MULTISPECIES: hypothetical protein [unclassified Novosphingobium]|uniref:hypothetical protein n=1 Tax=unclassified Novosphingobium TaxID=2644732 RepID=UPI000D41672E|nr:MULTISPECIES: hypothetical protein [unclassified Novosphingobium]PTR11800.1 hypothetical protein C8K11_104159 [Novosphingobium sp. GV055]PUB04840.1 hypothetical protein C8K12_104159 [Novosphingobium sp. GV061]PUB21159.1 hypothetical protein C8K14_104159 [Novosphingobium sp. GV079]PUB42885.1 hypothetical protein C8K10_104159 [Novosphingobium sp. GV027]